MNILRLTGGAPFDSEVFNLPGTISIFQGDSPFEFRNIRLNPPIIEQVETFSSNPCLITPPDVCVQKGTYTFTVNLPQIAESYYIVYQRCCRNPTINNIFRPEATGATYFIELTPKSQLECNNSPRFVNFPPPIICANDDLEFDHSAVDADGDSLVYSFCMPYLGGTRNNPLPDPDDPPPYSPVTFLNPYSMEEPMGGDPLVGVDPNIGLLSGRPLVSGQFVVAVCVEEYRDGELLSTIKREFQFNVANCAPFVLAQLQANNSIGDELFIVTQCGDTEILLSDASIPSANVTSHLWEITINEDSVFTSTSSQLLIDFGQAGTYEGKLTINPIDSMCTDTARIEINVSEGIEADFEVAGDTCSFGELDLIDNSIISLDAITAYDWDMGDGTLRKGNIISHAYQEPGEYSISLTIRDTAGCESVAEKSFSYFPIPDLDFGINNRVGCTPFEAMFFNRTDPMDSINYEFNWDFGDGNESFQANRPINIYDIPGYYNVGLEVRSKTGCQAERMLINYLQVEPSPEIDYSYSPNPFTKEDDELFFEVFTDPLNEVSWNFGLYGYSSARNPMVSIFDHQDTIFTRLITTAPNGCKSTEDIAIQVIPILRFFMPNIFTPNDDGYNDSLLPYFNCPVEDYHLRIFNRWGNLVFESFDQNQAWKFEFNDEIDPGVFVWIVNYVFDGKAETQKGDVTLMR
jgi:gliding motility-associated-like protein